MAIDGLCYLDRQTIIYLSSHSVTVDREVASSRRCIIVFNKANSYSSNQYSSVPARMYVCKINEYDSNIYFTCKLQFATASLKVVCLHLPSSAVHGYTVSLAHEYAVVKHSIVQLTND